MRRLGHSHLGGGDVLAKPGLARPGERKGEQHLPEAGLRRSNLDGLEAVVLDAQDERGIGERARLWHALLLRRDVRLGPEPLRTSGEDVRDQWLQHRVGVGPGGGGQDAGWWGFGHGLGRGLEGEESGWRRRQDEARGLRWRGVRCPEGRDGRWRTPQAAGDAWLSTHRLRGAALSRQKGQTPGQMGTAGRPRIAPHHRRGPGNGHRKHEARQDCGDGMLPARALQGGRGLLERRGANHAAIRKRRPDGDVRCRRAMGAGIALRLGFRATPQRTGPGRGHGRRGDRQEQHQAESDSSHHAPPIAQRPRGDKSRSGLGESLDHRSTSADLRRANPARAGANRSACAGGHLCPACPTMDEHLENGGVEAHPPIATPSRCPSPNVRAAAASPSTSCRVPLRTTPFPVKRVMAEPIPKSPSALMISAASPRDCRRGRRTAGPG